MVLPFSQDPSQLVPSVSSEQELYLLTVGRLNVFKKKIPEGNMTYAINLNYYTTLENC